MRSLNEVETSAHFTDAERTAIAYADAMTCTPVDVSDELYARVKRFFTEKQIVELTAMIAWENYRARFNHALAIESQGFSEGGFCPLPVPAQAHRG